MKEFSTMTSESQRKTWEIYASSWSESNPARRLEMFGECLQPDCVYTDPMVQLTGFDQLTGYMVELSANVPGVRFLTTDFVAHHGQSLAHWNMVGSDGQVLSHGASYGRYEANGKLLQMSGFFTT
jgi:hypothetical protein